MAEGGSICFDSHNNRVVIPYEDTGTNEGKAVVCTVSGTTVTAGTPVTFSTDAMQGQSIQSTFDSTLNKVIIAYIHDADSYVRIISGTVSGTSITFDTPIVVTSVGVTSGSVSIAYDSNVQRSLVGYKGSTTFGAVYVTTGTQSPLTIDSTYYIQNNGNITTTATGNTEIGKAVTTTQLLLKGAPLMKTIVENSTKLSKFLYEDDKQILMEEDRITIGPVNNPDLYVGCHSKNDCTLYENIEGPSETWAR